jgi:hypothetical protein
MAGYTKEFLIDAYLSRFTKIPSIGIEQLLDLERIAHKTYDTYGKDKFREYSSLDAEYLRNYKASLKR